MAYFRISGKAETMELKYNKEYQNSGETKASSYGKSIYVLQRFESSCTHFQAINFFCKSTKKVQVYQCKTP